MFARRLCYFFFFSKNISGCFLSNFKRVQHLGRGHFSSPRHVIPQGGQASAEIQVFHGSAVIFARALTRAQNTKALHHHHHHSHPLHLITVTFLHSEISTLSNLLFSFLRSPSLLLSFPSLASSILLPHWDLHSSSSKLNPPASTAAAEIPESEANTQTEYETSGKSSSFYLLTKFKITNNCRQLSIISSLNK